MSNIIKVRLNIIDNFQGRTIKDRQDAIDKHFIFHSTLTGKFNAPPKIDQDKNPAEKLKDLYAHFNYPDFNVISVDYYSGSAEIDYINEVLESPDDYVLCMASIDHNASIGEILGFYLILDPDKTNTGNQQDTVEEEVEVCQDMCESEEERSNTGCRSVTLESEQTIVNVFKGIPFVALPVSDAPAAKYVSNSLLALSLNDFISKNKTLKFENTIITITELNQDGLSGIADISGEWGVWNADTKSVHLYFNIGASKFHRNKNLIGVIPETSELFSFTPRKVTYSSNDPDLSFYKPDPETVGTEHTLLHLKTLDHVNVPFFIMHSEKGSYENKLALLCYRTSRGLPLYGKYVEDESEVTAYKLSRDIKSDPDFRVLEVLDDDTCRIEIYKELPFDLADKELNFIIRNTISTLPNDSQMTHVEINGAYISQSSRIEHAEILNGLDEKQKEFAEKIGITYQPILRKV